MSLPHPNWYDGPVEIKLHDDEEWHLVEPAFAPIQTHPTEKIRGLGVVDLLRSKSEHRTPRTSTNLALHVLEVLEAMQISSRERAYVGIETRTDRPAPLSRTDVDGWRA